MLSVGRVVQRTLPRSLVGSQMHVIIGASLNSVNSWQRRLFHVGPLLQHVKPVESVPKVESCETVVSQINHEPSVAKAPRALPTVEPVIMKIDATAPVQPPPAENPPKTIHDICVRELNRVGIIGSLYSAMTLFAIFLSFKWNNGFEFGHFVIAAFFPYLYIAYYLVIDSIKII